MVLYCLALKQVPAYIMSMVFVFLYNMLIGLGYLLGVYSNGGQYDWWGE